MVVPRVLNLRLNRSMHLAPRFLLILLICARLEFKLMLKLHWGRDDQSTRVAVQRLPLCFLLEHPPYRPSSITCIRQHGMHNLRRIEPKRA